MGIKSIIRDVIYKYYFQYDSAVCNVLKKELACCHYITTIRNKLYEPIYSFDDVLKNLTVDQVKMAYMFLINEHLVVTKDINVKFAIADKTTKHVETAFDMTTIHEFNNYSHFFNTFNFRIDDWSDYDGVEDNTFNFNSFFYDNAAQSNKHSDLFIYYSDMSVDDKILFRGYTVESEKIIDKKIIYS